jgi:hypothetical protein
VGWQCKDKSATKNSNVWGHVPNEGEWSLSNNKGIVPVKVLLAGTQRYQRRQKIVHVGKKLMPCIRRPCVQ